MFRGLLRLKTKFEAKNDCTNALGGTTASETPTGRDEIVVLRGCEQYELEAHHVLLLTIACDAWDNHSAILLS